MTKISTQPPSGFRDFTPQESTLRASLIDSIAKIYSNHGFQQIFTSACENLSTLQGKGGGQDNEHLIFKIQKRGEALEKAFSEASLKSLDSLSDLGLRFDLTLPLARYISRFRNDLPNPFKVFQMGAVWRAERAQKGRFREFIQCDVDIVGSSGIGAEVDCLSAISEVFSSLGIEDLELHLNDRRLLSGVGASLGIEAKLWQECLITMDKLDKIGIDSIEKELSEKIPSEQIPAILSLLKTEASYSSIANKFPNLQSILQEMEELFQILTNSLQNRISVRFSPSLVRGQDYYTGTIFEIRHKDLSGSLAGGGRYDRLLELFGGATAPAFGGSIGFERLCLICSENKIALPGSARNPFVFFPLFHQSLRRNVLNLANQLRQKGIACDIYPDTAKLKNQFKYANDRNIPYVAILAENELAQGKITIKTMKDGSETMVAISDFAEYMEKLCNTERIPAAN